MAFIARFRAHLRLAPRFFSPHSLVWPALAFWTFLLVSPWDWQVFRVARRSASHVPSCCLLPLGLTDSNYIGAELGLSWRPPKTWQPERETDKSGEEERRCLRKYKTSRKKENGRAEKERETMRKVTRLWFLTGLCCFSTFTAFFRPALTQTFSFHSDEARCFPTCRLWLSYSSDIPTV